MLVVLLACDAYLVKQLFIIAPTPTQVALQLPVEAAIQPTQLSSQTPPALLNNPTLQAETASPLPPPIDTATLPPAPTDTPQPTQTLTPLPDITIHFAVIGDYGEGNQAEEDVANLIKSWKPDFIITTGDNNYPVGAEDTLDDRVGQYYHEYIYNYHGRFGQGSETMRFFPTLGNHDWMSDRAQPYFDYFTLPGNGRYYDFTWGPVHFFALDTDTNEPDHVGKSSIQAEWLRQGLAAANEPWKIVYSHFPTYSSGPHGSTDYMNWPFQEWGASAVLAGHDHDYERLVVDGFPYFVDGLGGGPIYDFKDVLLGSECRYNEDYGAMLVEASSAQITFQFYNRQDAQIDSYTLQK